MSNLATDVRFFEIDVNSTSNLHGSTIDRFVSGHFMIGSKLA